MGFGMGLNLLLLVAMVATNILSLYHLSSTQTQNSTPPPPIPDHLIHQLNTIRATINHLTRLQNPSSATATLSPLPPSSELLLYTHLSPIASSCRDYPDLLHQFMNYTPFSLCPNNQISETLILRGCHPLPRRRCFSPKTPSKPPTNAPLSSEFISPKSILDLTIPQLFQITNNSNPIRLAIDIGGGTGTFAARMKLYNVTVITTTMNLGFPYNEAIAVRGLIPLHAPLQQRFPIFDGVLDLVRCGHAVNRWIPTVEMEFLFFDADRVLRAGGFLWLDHFFCKPMDLEKVYMPLIGKLGYKIVKWATGDKTDSKYGEIYLTALLQKPWK
ncbi:S-adenosyl-L-methionine-dependent methyltransferases superfamily protein [Tasmannia lanceolata]|uniref:S-adenosyl-L-methionine-dependent methyltransferases superfamily protein n=1 Tax=Tasmannia lanceolata TaxID=3420 RepID=UPI004063F7A0